MYLNYNKTKKWGISRQGFAIEGEVVLGVEAGSGSNPVNGEWFDDVLSWKELLAWKRSSNWFGVVQDNSLLLRYFLDAQ